MTDLYFWFFYCLVCMGLPIKRSWDRIPVRAKGVIEILWLGKYLITAQSLEVRVWTPEHVNISVLRLISSRSCRITTHWIMKVKNRAALIFARAHTCALSHLLRSCLISVETGHRRRNLRGVQHFCFFFYVCNLWNLNL